MQVDYKGQRVLGEVTKYDARQVRHEVEWHSQAGDKRRAWFDFCRDLVFGEFTGV